MQFQGPQFIDVEDKIIGPLTLRQFIYIAAAGGFSFVLFFALQTWLWVIATTILGLIAVAFAFIKLNGRSLGLILVAALKYAWQPKFYLWRREAVKRELPRLTSIPQQKHSAESLHDLYVKMNTSTQAIENREKPSATFSLLRKPAELLEKYEITQKQAGDRELYKRVDYR
jgi:hypothetical protein